LGGGWAGQVAGLVFPSVWFYVAALPTGTRKLMFLGKVGGSGIKWDMSAILLSNGKIVLNVAGNTRGTTTGAVSVGNFYNLQLAMKIDGANSVHIVKVLGETLSYAGGEPDTQAMSYLYLGKETSDATYDVYFSDFVLNDDQGSDENTYPDANEHVGYLFPIGENVISNWTGGAGGTTGLYDAVNNAPPLGNSSETDLTNIKNAVASAADDIDFVCSAYSSLGIGAGYNVHVVRAIVRHGEHTAANTKAGAVLVATNPAQSVEDGFNFGGNAGAHGTEISNWRTTYGAPQYNPTLAHETNPVVRLGKRTAITDVVCCDFIAIIVTYAPVPLQSADFFGSGGGVGGGEWISKVRVSFQGAGGGIGGGFSRMPAWSFRRQALWFANRMDGTLTIGAARTILKYPNLDTGQIFEEMVETNGDSVGIGQPLRLLINLAVLHNPRLPAVVWDAILRFVGESGDQVGVMQLLAYLDWIAAPEKTVKLAVDSGKATIRFPKWGRLKRLLLEINLPAAQQMNVENVTMNEMAVRYVQRPRIGRKFA
jgi:hypothetical protein